MDWGGSPVAGGIPGGWDGMAPIGLNYVNPDSVLARTALEMVQTHAGGMGPHDGLTVP